ncbi:MAG TPA: GMC family oxidoreductase [Thermoanaerobaculia bacterium]|nr:GMC family oxidoreductase [Thermoanaerobaculia bacterium]
MPDEKTYDVVIVGAGIAGAIVAERLGRARKRVLILEAGPGIPPNRNDYMQSFYMASAKVVESPYPPPVEDPETPLDPALQNTPRPTTLTLSTQKMNGVPLWRDPKRSYFLYKDGSLPFGSTYERVAGGTTWHWVGTCLRLLPTDFKERSDYGVGVDWPITYEDLMPWYDEAEKVIGVAGDQATEDILSQQTGIPYGIGHQFPMRGIPPSYLDQTLSQAVDGTTFDNLPVLVSPTPQGRNSQPYQNRRVCEGNTNCTPICPIQAKYDSTVTLGDALQTGFVDLQPQSVATRLAVDGDGRIDHVEYIQYQKPNSREGAVTKTARGTLYVLAAHAVETPKILLNSATDCLPNGVANSSDQVGRNLMDHTTYLAWALMPEGRPVYPYRGPISTSGIESLRTGPFRSQRAAFRIEIGNEGWNWPTGDPYTTTLDLINGTNNGALNPEHHRLYGPALVNKLNDLLTREFRLAFLVEQEPDPACRVTLSQTYTDHLGIPRPEINYNLTEYTRLGFQAADRAARQIFASAGAQPFTTCDKHNPGTFELDGTPYNYYGAGHVLGTYRMGASRAASVVDRLQRSWDHDNLFLIGGGVFPTVGTANPTLTIAALSCWAAQSILSALPATA